MEMIFQIKYGIRRERIRRFSFCVQVGVFQSLRSLKNRYPDMMKKIGTATLQRPCEIKMRIVSYMPL